MKKTKVGIKQDEDEIVPVEVLAKEIQAISEGIKVLRKGRLNDRALILLIQNASPANFGKYGTSKPSATDVRGVIQGIESLASAYLK